MIKAPVREPKTVPSPPIRLVPPKTTTEITSNSDPEPKIPTTENKREVRITAVAPPVIPEITYARKIVFFTFTPTSLLTQNHRLKPLPKRLPS